MEKRAIRPDYLQLEWISAAEGVRFTEVMTRMEELRKGVSRQEIADTVGILEKRSMK